MRFLFVIFLIVISLNPAHALSCPEKGDCESGAAFAAFLPIAFVESAILAESTLAAYHPDLAGLVAGVSMTFSTVSSGEAGGYGDVAWILSSGVMAAYNMAQAEYGNSGADVFAVNFVGWHVVGLVTEYFSQKYISRNRLQISLDYNRKHSVLGAALSFSF